MDLVSIIVPFFNVENYIEKCLESLRNQTYRCIEVLLINDGSTDGSRKIADTYCRLDSRFRLIDQSNGGLSSARNTGLRYASGEFLAFIDSDDWVEREFVESLLLDIQMQQADFACCRLGFVNEGRGCTHIYGKKYLIDSLSGEDILLDSLLIKNIPTSVCVKLYRTSFLRKNNLLFKEGIVNEDSLYTPLAALYARKVSFVNQVLYYALERSGSISRSSYERLFRDMDVALNELREKMIRENVFQGKVESSFYARYVRSMLYNLLQSVQRLPYPDYEQAYQVCVHDTNYLKYGKWVRYLPIYHQLMFQVSRSCQLLYVAFGLLNRFGFYMH